MRLKQRCGQHCYTQKNSTLCKNIELQFRYCSINERFRIFSSKPLLRDAANSVSTFITIYYITLLLAEKETSGRKCDHKISIGRNSIEVDRRRDVIM